MRHFDFKILHKQTDQDKMSNEGKMLRRYLEDESPVSYGEHALEATVQDVLSLDADLKEYVLHFIQTKDMTCSIACECASINDLLQTGRFTPITAALLIQWYRRDPVAAASFLMHHDRVTDIPENLPETEE